MVWSKGSVAVYPLAPTPRELNSNISSSGGDVDISRHSRAGSDQARSSRHRRGSRASQHQQLPSFTSLNSPPESSQGLNPPLHAPIYPTVSVQYPPQPLGRPGQYMVSTAPPPNMTHSDYPIIASYSSYDPETAQPPSSAYVSSFRYPLPISPIYPAYPQPPATYPPLHVHPSTLFPRFPPQSSGGAQDGDGGTWYYVPPQQQPQLLQQYDTASAPPSQQQPLPMQQRREEYDSNTSYAHPSTPRLSSSPPSPIVSGGRDNGPIQRRPYHPNPPGQRSEWVMWAGNVPSEANRDELWRFFTAPRDGGESTASSNSNEFEVSAGSSGVVSIFPISRSNCAFVNYDTEAHLQAAIERFNGVPLRQDPRCARLVCRARHKDEDLGAGVGGQRGIGLHQGWVKEKEKGKAVDNSTFVPSAGTTGTNTLNAARSLALNSLRDDDHAACPPPHLQANSSSSGSQASTNSSLLQRHFPQRFFILKSHKQDDLDLSVQTGVWATQMHNEGVLDRAFRNSKNVFLIFSVNKSGEFYGYARMAGPIGEGIAEHVVWGAKSGPPLAARSPGAATGSAPSPTTTHHDPHAAILSDEHLVENSPAPLATPTSTPLRPSESHSAPPALERRHHSPYLSPAVKHSLDQLLGGLRRGIDMDEAHQRTHNASSAPRAGTKEEHGEAAITGEESVDEKSDDGSAGTREVGWGREFRLDWVCNEPLSFQHMRHLRNPWNHNREVKVSRDGTELEPSVGQALLAKWRRETERD
ncbi:YT521-B-like domain-containing protein [Mycena crocata]|nr:YT521-B-like domain-containing protein [Mycena crocata]